MVKVGLWFVAATGGPCHCVILDRQGQIVVVHGAAMAGGRQVGAFCRAILLLDGASRTVSFTVD